MPGFANMMAVETDFEVIASELTKRRAGLFPLSLCCKIQLRTVLSFYAAIFDCLHTTVKHCVTVYGLRHTVHRVQFLIFSFLFILRRRGEHGEVHHVRSARCKIRATGTTIVSCFASGDLTRSEDDAICVSKGMWTIVPRERYQKQSC